jgi:O-antigen ligase
MSWRAWVITVWTGIVFIFSTLLWAEPLLDGSSPSAATGRSAIDLLIAAISGSKPGDLRTWVLPIGLAGLLSIVAFPETATPPQPTSRKKKKPAERVEAPPGTSPSRWTRHWLEIVAMVLVGLAIASTSVNGTWRLSREWILQLAAGCAWAILLSRFAHDRCVNRILFVGAMIALCATVMSFVHRHEHYVEFFAWPIGPVTLTAGMAAIWAAVALAIAICVLPRAARANASPGSIVLTIVVIVAALSLLFVAARRAAWLAVLVAGAYSAILVILRYDKSRRARRMVPTSVVVFVALAAAYFYFQSRSSNPSASIPIAYRLIYWKNTVAHLSDDWFFGHGPDMFVAKMSTIIGQERGHMPRILHGNIDPEAHNEWLQAMFELGLPGGLLYLAIPVVAIGLATRAWLRDTAVIHPITLLACASGLIAIVVSESGSICLRRGGMNIWYWTLIGIIAGGTRGTIVPQAGARTRRHSGRFASARSRWPSPSFSPSSTMVGAGSHRSAETLKRTATIGWRRSGCRNAWSAWARGKRWRRRLIWPTPSLPSPRRCTKRRAAQRRGAKRRRSLSNGRCRRRTICGN